MVLRLLLFVTWERAVRRSDGEEPKRIGYRAPSQRRSRENERGSDTEKLGGAVWRHLKREGGGTSVNKWGAHEKQCDKVQGGGGKAAQRCADVAEEVGRQESIASFIQSKTLKRVFFHLHLSFVLMFFPPEDVKGTTNPILTLNPAPV